MRRSHIFIVISFLFICDLQTVYPNLKSEVCLVQDLTVLKRKSVVIGERLRVLEMFSAVKCMKECLTLFICKSVNIYPDLLRCELMLQNSADASGGVVTSLEGMTIDAEDIPEEYAGGCTGHNCSLTEKCIERQSKGYICALYDFCDELPASLVNTNYAIDRSRGVPIADYSCVPGTGYTGGVTKSFCNPLINEWSEVDIVCSTGIPDLCGIPPSPLVPHNIIRPYGGDANLTAYTCLSLSGQVPKEHCPVTRCIGTEQWTSGANISCSVEDCYVNGEYSGLVTCTNTGKTCQRWDQQTPHSHSIFKDRSDLHNYCKMHETDEPWCYTMDPASRWEYCPVPHC